MVYWKHLLFWGEGMFFITFYRICETSSSPLHEKFHVLTEILSSKRKTQVLCSAYMFNSFTIQINLKKKKIAETAVCDFVSCSGWHEERLQWSKESVTKGTFSQLAGQHTNTSTDTCTCLPLTQQTGIHSTCFSFYSKVVARKPPTSLWAQWV